MSSWFFLGVSSTFLVDQLLKSVFCRYFFDSLLINQGSLFGFRIGSPIWLNGAVLISLLIWSIKADKKSQIGLSLIFGGGVSNLFDRIIRGGVVDFNISRFFVFNLADLIIITGVFLLVWQIFLKDFFKKDEIEQRDSQKVD